MLTVGSLFTGIGGLDLGLERAGMTVAWQAEIDPYCCQVLNRHWPAVPNLGDVTTINWEDVPRVDVLTGGYPCQPFSLAGRRDGEYDPRHLWPYVRDAVSVLRPRWVLLENVTGHLTLGFGRVLGELAEIGYDAEWDCLPAAAFGAPHRRDRVFIVAYPNRSRVREEPVGERRGEHPVEFVADGTNRTVADTNSKVGCGTWGASEKVFRQETFQRSGRRCGSSGGHWAVEPDVGRVAHGVPNRVDRLRALGNAVVPQVAEHIGRLIVETETREMV